MPSPNRQYVQPQALNNHGAQGNFFYRPLVFAIEANTVADLNAQLNQAVSDQSQDPLTYYVIKDLQYQAVYSPPNTKYSVLVHAELAENK